MNFIEEYLVKIGATVDIPSFTSANGAVGSLYQTLDKLRTVLKYGGIAAMFAMVTEAVVGNVKSVAAADMKYQKLAQQMWVTKETAKALNVILETMNASQEDVAWVAELREQFFRLRQEMQELATPADADNQLRWIRSIGYDVESLQLKLKMLKEWIAYYLIKYLEPYIAEFRGFVRWLNKQLGDNLPKIANKVAAALAVVMRLIYAGGRAMKTALDVAMRIFDALPDKIKALVPAFAAAGALIMTSPFGLMLTAIGGALVLLEDFFGYIDGKESSSTLAPLWKALLEFANGSGKNFLDGVKVKLEEILEIIYALVGGVDFAKVYETNIEGVQKLFEGFDRLANAVGNFFKRFDIDTPKVQQFFESVGKYIGFTLRQISRLGGLVGDIFAAVAEAIDGNFKNAAQNAWDAVETFFAAGKRDLLGVAGSPLSRAQDIVDNQYAEFLGNENGCTNFARAVLGDDNDFIKSLDDNLYVPDWKAKADEQGRYHEGLVGAQAGDILVYDYDGDNDGDHVTIYDGKGGAYGNSTTQKKPMYYEDANSVGRVIGYISAGNAHSGANGLPSHLAGNADSYATDYVKGNLGQVAASASRLAQPAGNTTYNGGSISVGNITVNTQATSPDGIGEAVREKMLSMRDIISARNAGGVLSS